MLNAQRAIPWIGGAAVAAVQAMSVIWLSVPSVLLLATPGHLAESSWYSLPDNVRSQALYYILTTIATVVGLFVPAALFFLLSKKVARHPDRARRYLAASAVGLLALSAWWYMASWSHGLQYQGSGFIYLNLALSGSALLSMVAVAVCWRLWRTPALPMLFLWLEFAWVLGCAFPWLGETF